MESLKEDFGEPVSPMGQYCNSSVLCLYILGVLEFEVPIHDLPIASLVRDVYLPINSRFSSIMVDDKNRKKRWKQVEVKLEEHIIVPEFPNGLSPDSYDECFNDYLTRLAMEHPPQTKPLWEIHVIKYPTSNAAGTLIFKLHHALGDGYSLMGVVLSCLQRADDPSIPLTFPSCKSSNSKFDNKSIFIRLPRFVSSLFNSISDLGSSLLKHSVVEDDKTPIRSGDEGVEFRPATISNMAFSLDLIKEIKSKLRVTINDVITGILFCGIRLYMQDVEYRSGTAQSTAMVLLNTRNTKGYQSVKDMLKTEAKGSWGNKFSFLHVSVPKVEGAQISNPLQFVWKAHDIINRKRNSLSVFIVGWLLQMKHKFRGHEAVARHIHRTAKKSSLAMSNIVGPVEQMAMANHPVKSFYFMVTGGPQSLGITVMSYMGVLRVTFRTEQGFINEQKLKSRVNDAFEMILKAARDLPSGK